jgi:hypothetical protein
VSATTPFVILVSQKIQFVPILSISYSPSACILPLFSIPYLSLHLSLLPAITGKLQGNLPGILPIHWQNGPFFRTFKRVIKRNNLNKTDS